ncbi:MAG: M28 family peptidase [Gemmatimonadetes bacterium]|nr:M28 family peptidase [Gemmatimonadota bacterium]
MTFPVLSRAVAAPTLSLATIVLLGACASSGSSAGAAAGGAPAASAFTLPVSGALPLKYTPRPTSAAISAGDLMSRLYAFSDDSLMGRDAGTEGSFKATAMLAAEAQRLGLQPAGENGTYFQVLPLKTKRIDTASFLRAGSTTLKLRSEWGFSGASPMSLQGAPLIFAGELGKASLPADQVAGKVVAFTMPLSQEGVQLVVGSKKFLPAGARGILVILPGNGGGIIGYLMQNGPFVDDPAAATESRVLVLGTATQALFGKPVGELTPGAMGTPIDVEAKVSAAPSPFAARNVVAILPGSDPVLKHTYVAVGAHSDHVGMVRRAADHDSILIFNRIVRPGGAEDSDKFGTPEQFTRINQELAALRATRPSRPDSIFNGADDDGSGSVSVQEIAEYMASLKTKPKRSTLFVWHVGEEKGLWGSAYFTEHPTVPRDSIVAQLNIDMVGRGAATDETGKSKDGKPLYGGPNYVQLVGSRRLSTELGDLVEQVNTAKGHGMTFDYGMDANGHPMNIYCRSDHYEYAKWNIPVTFFTTGGHSAYHQLTDEAQYIDYPHMTKVARLIADIAVELGNRTTRVKVDGARMDPRGECKQ